ncbi:MAG: alpha/beta hydrolase [Salibacteraceae bacterium]
MRKSLKIVVACLFLVGVLFLHFYAPRFITEIKNPFIETAKGSFLITTTPKFENNQLPGKYITFESFDKVELSCYLTYSSRDIAKGTIILLHGIRSNKECFIGLVNKLSLLGYNSVALDSRAHGGSKGVHCTFGVKEKQDISELINVLEKREGITGNVGVWGQSLGGAIALQAMGIDKRIQFGIIESTFSEFRTITNDYFKYHVGFNIPPLTNYLVYRAGLIANFDPAEACPSKYCININQPILIVHGNQDNRIAIKYAKENFENISGKKKNFIEVEGANHLNVWKVGGDDYFEKAINFLNENTANYNN